MLRNNTLTTLSRGRRSFSGSGEPIRLAVVWVFHDVPPYYFKFALKTFAVHSKVAIIDIHLVCGENITEDHTFQSGRLHSHRLYIHSLSDGDWKARISDRLGITMPYSFSDHPRKLADVKPMLGLLLDDFLPTFKYDYWVYGDSDGFFGNIESIIDMHAARKYDIISGYSPRPSVISSFGFDSTEHYALGSFTMIRNSPKMNRLFMRSANYDKVLTDYKHYYHFDENSGADVVGVESFHQVLAFSDDVRKCCLNPRIPQVLLDPTSHLVVLDLSSEFMQGNITTVMRWEINKPITFSITRYDAAPRKVVSESISAYFVHLLQWKFVRPTLYRSTFVAFINRIESLPNGYSNLKCFELTTRGALYLSKDLYEFSLCSVI
jgi:hypothetical protein